MRRAEAERDDSPVGRRPRIVVREWLLTEMVVYESMGKRDALNALRPADSLISGGKGAADLKPGEVSIARLEVLRQAPRGGAQGGDDVRVTPEVAWMEPAPRLEPGENPDSRA